MDTFNRSIEFGEVVDIIENSGVSNKAIKMEAVCCLLFDLFKCMEDIEIIFF